MICMVQYCTILIANQSYEISGIAAKHLELNKRQDSKKIRRQAYSFIKTKISGQYFLRTCIYFNRNETSCTEYFVQKQNCVFLRLC